MTKLRIESRYEFKRHDGASLHIIKFYLPDHHGPESITFRALLLPLLFEGLQDEDFAFGILDGRAAFMFRTKSDALYCHKVMKRYFSHPGSPFAMEGESPANM